MSDLRGDQNQVVYNSYIVGRKPEKNGTSNGNTAFVGIFNFEPFQMNFDCISKKVRCGICP